MVLSISMRVPGGLSVHSLSENSYAACIQLYPPEDEKLRLKARREEEYFMNK